jgi:lysine-N-methylase
MKAPSYAANFRCIGSSCEDSCCSGWVIPVDKRTYEKYQEFPKEKCGDIVSEFVSVSPAASYDNVYAQVRPRSSGRCPFHTADRLCAIQQEYGPALLPATCSVYPRVLNYVEGVLEGSLLLSCPEAARQVLLDPAFFEVDGDCLSGEFRLDNTFELYVNCAGAPYKPVESFHEIRGCLIGLITDRSRPLWKRLLIVGVLCRQLDSIRSAEDARAVRAIVADYRQPEYIKRLSDELDKLPAGTAVRISVLFRLTDVLMRNPGCGARFVETYWAFIEGIGSSNGAGPDDDIRRFQDAERLYYHPFFDRFPFILENLLLNSMFRTLFPFGQSGGIGFSSRSIFEEYVILVTHFAWVTGLLVGVAGSCKESFSNEHVIRAIQSHAREVDHDKATIARMLEMMREAGLDSLEGAAVMLRP